MFWSTSIEKMLKIIEFLGSGYGRMAKSWVNSRSLSTYATQEMATNDGDFECVSFLNLWKT
jgi:hypothetical protein